MSFGFSVGDIVTLSTFALRVYESCKNSSTEFRSLTKEIGSLRLVLERTQQCLPENSSIADGTKELEQVQSECHDLLAEIERHLNKYSGLGDSATKKRHHWHRLGWALNNNVSSFRSRLTSYVGILTVLNGNLINSSQARLERDMSELMWRTSLSTCQSPDPCLTNTATESIVHGTAVDTLRRNRSMPITYLDPSRQEEQDSSHWITHAIAEQEDSFELVDEPTLDEEPVEMVAQRGHLYMGVTAVGNSAQINGNIGFQDGPLRRRHTYNCAMASGNGRQINGDVFDSSLIRELLRVA